ncbi:MAG: peptidase S10 [Opitutus sp.]|nr:peptidase S10 [Opitutus sp.]
MKLPHLLSTLVLASALTVVAQEEPKEKSGDRKPAVAPAAPLAEKDPAPSVTEGEITIGGKVIRYQATAGYLVQRGEKGEPRANIFYVAYTKLGENDVAKRPVTFSFNGGPGASSVWLHMGGLGPKRVVMTDQGGAVPPPYRYADNEFSWLDETDLVFVDPVSSGYSRAAKDVDAKQFHGFTADLESLADFIQVWTTRNARWTSPKFMVGESYGTTRVSALAERLQQKHDLYVNGVMLVSSILNFQTARFAPGNDDPYPLFLPTYTATAWHHKRLKGDWAKTLAGALKRSEEFASKDYVVALMQGSALSDSERDRVATELATLTGLSVEFVKKQNLRVTINRFIRELRRDEAVIVGRLDSSVSGILDEGDGAGEGGGVFFDPSMEAIRGPYAAAMSDYARTVLKFETDLHYGVLVNVQPWSYRNVENTYLDVSVMLKSAMVKNPFMKVWVANGYYDLATPYFATDWTFRHMNLPKAIRGNVTMTYYEAGHMMYTHVDSLKKLKTDFSQWINATLTEHKAK